MGACCTQPAGTFFAGGAIGIVRLDGHCTGGLAAAVCGTHVVTVGVLSDGMPRRARSAGDGDAALAIFVDRWLSPLASGSGLSQQFAYSAAAAASISSAAAAAKVAVQPKHADPEDPDAATRASSAALAVSVIAAKAAERSRSRGGGATAGHGTAGNGASKNPAKGSIGLLPSFELDAVEDTVPSTGRLDG